MKEKQIRSLSQYGESEMAEDRKPIHYLSDRNLCDGYTPKRDERERE